MEQIPTLSAICDLMDGKNSGWEGVKPIVKVLLTAAADTVAGSLGIPQELLEKLESLKDIFVTGKAFFHKETINFRKEYHKCGLANTLLIYAAYFDMLRLEEPELWMCMAMEAEEAAWMIEKARTDCEAFNLENREPDKEELIRFYEQLNQRIRAYAGKLRSCQHLTPAWEEFPAAAEEAYRQQLLLLAQKSHDFQIWHEAQRHEEVIGLLQGNRQGVLPPIHLPLGESMGSRRFQGRDRELKEMEAMLNGGNPIVLTGLGGMGKTELAKAFGWKYRSNGRGEVYFATFGGSFRDTVLGSIAAGVLGLPQKRTEQETYDVVMGRLRQCSRQDLLIIDNVDGTSETFEALRDSAYDDLCGLSAHVILTTRYQVPGALEIRRLDDAFLYEIFAVHGATLSQEAMDDLIRAVDGHTMTIDLIARTIGESDDDVTPDMILDAMKRSTLAEADYPEVWTDHGRRQAQIYAHLQALFRLSGISEAGRSVLRYGTLLPLNGLAAKRFRTAVTPEEKCAIPELKKRGWLQVDDGCYTMHPVVRLVCRQELKPTDENCNDFLAALRKQYDPNQYDQVLYRQLAELFSTASDVLEDKQGYFAHWAGRMWRELGEHSKALAYITKELTILEKVLPKVLPSEHPDLATSYNNVGCTYGALGEHQKALEYKLKALEIQEKILPLEHPALAIIYNNVGSTYGDLGEYQRALEYKLKALVIQEKVLPLEHPTLAISYNNVGSTYGALGEHRKALEYKLKALEILKKVLPQDHPYIMDGCANVAVTLIALNRFREALQYAEQALAIAQRRAAPDLENYQRLVDWLRANI